MKKLLAVVLLLAVSAGAGFAESTPAQVREGVLAYSKMSVELEDVR